MRHFTLPVIVAAALALATGATLAPSPSEAGPAAAQGAPVNQVPPKISGKPRVGQTLSASQGEWQGEPTAFFYQWLRCDSGGANCAPVANATAPTYALTADDVGSRIRVEVVASNADGASPAARSSATRAVRIAVPALVSPPTIAGVAREGETLTANPGQWSGSPTSFAYTWKRCLAGSCSTVGGATAQTYALTGADVGARLRVRVVANNPGGRSKAASSRSTATVKPAAEGFALGKVKRDRKRGLARFRVSVPSPGTLTLARTAKVRGETRRVELPRMVKLTVKPRGRARTKLRRRGKVKVRAFVTFAPDAGTPRTQARRIRLKQGRGRAG